MGELKIEGKSNAADKLTAKWELKPGEPAEAQHKPCEKPKDKEKEKTNRRDRDRWLSQVSAPQKGVNPWASSGRVLEHPIVGSVACCGSGHYLFLPIFAKGKAKKVAPTH